MAEHDKMMRMMMGKKKEGKTLSDSEKKSKLEALMGMKSLADHHMGNKLKNLKKVTVASNTPEGLKAGLHKAEDMADPNNEDMSASNMEDENTDEMSKFSKGGKVGEDAGHVMHMPEGFDTDGDQAMKEAKEMAGNDEEHPDNSDEDVPSPEPVRSVYADGTDDAENSDPSMMDDSDKQPESVDQIAMDADHLDPQELQELIEKLKMKLGNS